MIISVAQTLAESVIDWTLDRVADIFLPAELFFAEFEQDEI
jgi:hypothetical protein